MQAIWPSLPEFDLSRFDTEASPIPGSRDLFTGESIPDLFLILFQPIPVFDHFALRGSPGAYPAAFGPAVKIFIIFRIAERHAESADTHLPFQLFPEKYQAGPGVFRQLLPFGTIIIREESKPFFVEPFQQHDARIGHTVGGGRSQRHGIDLIDARAQRFLPPFSELSERIGENIPLGEGLQFIVFAEVGNGIHSVKLRKMTPIRHLVTPTA